MIKISLIMFNLTEKLDIMTEMTLANSLKVKVTLNQ